MLDKSSKNPILITGKRLIKKVGVDQAIAYTVIGRSIQAAGGFGIGFCIAHYLTKVEQGYYYTFASILAIQVFFELGLNAVITQYAAHEMAHLTWEKDLSIEGDDIPLSRLAHLLRFCIKSFLMIAVCLFVILVAAGYYFFYQYNSRNNVDWQGPWIIFALTTAGFFVVDPLLSFLQGIGKVKDVAQYRMYQQVAYIIFVVVFLMAGLNLYSPAIASLLSLFSVTVKLFFSPYKQTLVKLWGHAGQWKINYRTEIFPFQWKIALSWISGYFIYQLFTPVLFATEGAATAGQMGMSLAGLSGIAALSGSWVYTKIPLFSSLIARKQFSELDTSFYKNLYQSLFICVLGLALFFSVVRILQIENLSLGKRFLPLLPFSILIIIAFINQVNFSFSTYLRCHNKEPLLVQSIIIGCLSCLSTFTLGKMYGVIGITAGYLLMVLINLPWTIHVFKIKKQQWHTPLVDR